jgi:tetratricopeptide (TPR) repeat protein
VATLESSHIDQMLEPLFRKLEPSVPRRVPLAAVIGILVTPAAVAESAAGAAAGAAPGILMAFLVAVLLSAVIVMGLILWSRKQEHLHDMVLFCMKYLTYSENEGERAHSARALGRAKDPGALLTLANLTWDEEEPEAVRKAASEALHEMSRRLRAYAELIPDLEAAAEQRDFPRIIELITVNFEQADRKYVQSAYIVGRHYMRLGRYADARDWLEKAEFRNRKFNLYGNRIRRWIQECNTRLLKEADDMFNAADYHGAREHYAVLGHGLSDVDGRRWAVYLRSACVYCKLRDYRNADQALLQALDHQQAPDLVLTLSPLLQEILDQGDNTGAPSKEQAEQIERAIDERASAIMEVLFAQKPSRRRA